MPRGAKKAKTDAPTSKANAEETLKQDEEGWKGGISVRLDRKTDSGEILRDKLKSISRKHSTLR